MLASFRRRPTPQLLNRNHGGELLVGEGPGIGVGIRGLGDAAILFR